MIAWGVPSSMRAFLLGGWGMKIGRRALLVAVAIVLGAVVGSRAALAQPVGELSVAPPSGAPRILVVIPGDRAARTGAADMAAGSVDLVTLIFNYHDLGHLGVDRDAMNRALKSSGYYLIVDHAGRTGPEISEAETLHQIEQVFLRREVAAAGFRVVAEGNVVRKPNDPRDKNSSDLLRSKNEFVLGL